MPPKTQIWFLCAHLVGLAIYLLYGARKSVVDEPGVEGAFQ
jgi:hypothetical protein